MVTKRIIWDFKGCLEWKNIIIMSIHTQFKTKSNHNISTQSLCIYVPAYWYINSQFCITKMK